MIATACDVGGSFGPLGCSRHVVSPATRPTATTGENRVMREPMAHLWPGAYLPRRSRALEVGAGSGTNGTKLRRFAGQRKIVGRPAALPTTYVPSGGPSNRDRPARAHGHGRPGDGVSLREAPARDRRPPPAPAGPVGRGHLLPHAGGLPPVARARGPEPALRRDRRRLYRQRDCRGAA